MNQPDPNVLFTVHIQGWKLGLKTGSYYLRTKPAVDMQAFTVAPGGQGFTKQTVDDTVNDTADRTSGKNASDGSCSKDAESKPGVVKQVGGKTFVCHEEEGCMMCGS